MAKVGFIGLGKLGLPVAEAMACTHTVMGYDIDSSIETERVMRAQSIGEAVVGCEFIFIAVPTPHDPEYDGSTPSSHLPPRDFDYTQVVSVLHSIARFVEKGQKVVIISTCLPGTVRGTFDGILPSDVYLIYNPYFIAMGTVTQDFYDPEFMLIGSSHQWSYGGERLIEFYKSMLGIPSEKYICMTWEEAECTKVFYNTWISWKLAFVNMVQDVSESIGNMDVDVVTEALSRAKKRIMSDEYMEAGMGDGGPCHPRDNIALSSLADTCNLDYDLFGAIMGAREQQAQNMANCIAEHGNDIVIIGKSFKPGVPYTDGSYSLLVGHYLEEFGCDVTYHDPLTGDAFNRVEDKYVFLLAHDDTYGVEFHSGDVVVDPWRTRHTVPEGVNFVSYGDTRRDTRRY